MQTVLFTFQNQQKRLQKIELSRKVTLTGGHVSLKLKKNNNKINEKQRQKFFGIEAKVVCKSLYILLQIPIAILISPIPIAICIYIFSCQKWHHACIYANGFCFDFVVCVCWWDFHGVLYEYFNDRFATTLFFLLP